MCVFSHAISARLYHCTIILINCSYIISHEIFRHIRFSRFALGMRSKNRLIILGMTRVSTISPNHFPKSSLFVLPLGQSVLILQVIGIEMTNIFTQLDPHYRWVIHHQPSSNQMISTFSIALPEVQNRWRFRAGRSIHLLGTRARLPRVRDDAAPYEATADCPLLGWRQMLRQ